MRPATSATKRRTPLFTEVRDALLAGIAEGRFAVGDRLPSEPDLAFSHGVSRPTLREVLRSLEADGVVRRVHGVGTFINRSEPLVRTALDLDVGVTEAVAAARATLGIEIVRVVIEAAPSWAAAGLELPDGGSVLSVERIIRANGTPAVHGLDMIPATVLGGQAASAYDGGSIYRFLEHECQIHLVGGIADVTAVAATPALARYLATPRNSPLLRLDQVEKSVDGRPVLFSREHYAPGVFSLTVRRLRHQRADLTAGSDQGVLPKRGAHGTEVRPVLKH
ncbi:MAG: GntR family transcriptional regulator [Chloroflexota bacterium]|jgi:GntR family transcriptional regulator|nr:GntR family transcriptional regulator [Chloroflexota bacterium]